MTAKEPAFSLDWAPDAIIVTGSDRTIVHVNPRAESLFGYQREELVDRPLELLMPEGLPAGAERDAPLQHISRDVTCAHRDGTRFMGVLRWRPATVNGDVLWVFALRETETASISEARADARGRRSESIELFSLFTHDVRQSLQSVQFLCDSISHQSPEAVATISEIVGSVGRLLERLSWIDDPDGVRPHRERCTLEAVLGSLGRELSPLAERKGLQLVIKPARVEVITDPILFRELLHNLITNAIRYTESGSVEIRCRSAAAQVQVEVADTGVGLDESQVDEILRGSLEGTSRSGGAGTGLGLSIVQRLARVLGCALEVESAPGRGSCFKVIAPAGTAAEGHGSPARRKNDG